MEPWDALGLVDLALSLCNGLFSMFQTMKTNRQLCRDLAKKVEALQGLVGTIHRSDQVPLEVCKALKALCENLDTAHGLVAKFSNVSPISGFLKSDSIKEKLLCVDKKLIDSLQILTTSLQVQHGRVLNRVYETVKDLSPCSRPPLPDLQTSRSPTAAVPAACCGAPISPTAAAVPFMVPTSPVMVPLVFTTTPTPGSFTATSTTFVSRGVSSKALKAALQSRPQINISQIYAAEHPAVTGRYSLLPAQFALNKTLNFY